MSNKLSGVSFPSSEETRRLTRLQLKLGMMPNGEKLVKVSDETAQILIDQMSYSEPNEP